MANNVPLKERMFAGRKVRGLQDFRDFIELILAQSLLHRVSFCGIGQISFNMQPVISPLRPSTFNQHL